jgi:transcriptional regulator with XRE-family HTH domain
MNYEKTIASRIKKLRGQKGMTTTHLAKLVGVSQPQITRLENGKEGFRSSTLVKIATALGVKPAYFWIENEAQANRLAGPSSK